MPGLQQQLRDWWLAVPKRANTPNWDLASTCRIEGRQGLLLVEAKAHTKELSYDGKRTPDTENGRRNRKRIGSAIEEANADLEHVTGESWGISRDACYQLSNRFACVMAALREPWSNGQTEGQINKLKTLKRQMYGRAGLDLLRARLVPAA